MKGTQPREGTVRSIALPRTLSEEGKEIGLPEKERTILPDGEGIILAEGEGSSFDSSRGRETILQKSSQSL